LKFDCSHTASKLSQLQPIVATASHSSGIAGKSVAGLPAQLQPNFKKGEWFLPLCGGAGFRASMTSQASADSIVVERCIPLWLGAALPSAIKAGATMNELIILCTRGSNTQLAWPGG